MSEDHKVIWLQPWCENCAKHEDRTWCEDNVWSEGCEECGAMPAKYVLDPVKSTGGPGAA